MRSNNRQFLRVPVSSASGTVVVRLDGKKTLACELLNTSSGGYGVLVPAECAPAFPPGRILVLEVDDVVMQVKVAHGAWEEDRLLVGFERIAELEDEAAVGQQQASWLSTLCSPTGERAQGQSTLVRDVVIATVLACSLLAFLFLPALLEMLQGKKKLRNASAPAAAQRTGIDAI